MLYTGWIYTLARNTQYHLFCFALLFAFEFAFALVFLILLLKCVFLREKHAASDFEKTNIEDRVVWSVWKEEIPICFDFRITGVGMVVFTFLLSTLSLRGGLRVGGEDGYDGRR